MRGRMRTTGPQLWLVALGIGLGYLARIVFGGPATDPVPDNSFRTPIVDPVEEIIDLPIIGDQSVEDASGLVRPISVPAENGLTSHGKIKNVRLANFSHDDRAIFEPHGEQVCASGCAVSRHPTGNLTKQRFEQLLEDYPQSPLDETNAALEELLFYGPQTRRMIAKYGCPNLAAGHFGFLQEQLAYTHAKISIRVVDQNGVIRTWLDSSLVPFDRRHVFQMQTENLQPLVTSGTVKRVGLKHLWTRL